MSEDISNFSFMDKDTFLIILVKKNLFIYKDNIWNNILIDDSDLPNTDFDQLLKPSLVEIYQKSDSNLSKQFLIIGGFSKVSKIASKMIFTLDISKENNSKCTLNINYNDMSQTRFYHNSANINNKYIIVVGGKNTKEFLSTCEYLNLESKKWTKFPSLSTPRSNFTMCVVNGNSLYAYGGYKGIGTFIDKKLSTESSTLCASIPK